MNVLDGCKNLTSEDYDIIMNNVGVNTQALEGHRQAMVSNVGKLYDVMSRGIVTIDSHLNFYFQMYGHLDGTLRDLIRSKLATLFNPRVRDEAKGAELSRCTKYISFRSVVLIG